MKYTYIVNYNQFKTFENSKLDKITNITVGSKFIKDKIRLFLTLF